MASESKYEWLRRTGKTFLTSEDSSDIVNTAIEVGESLVALADQLEVKTEGGHPMSISGFSSLQDLAVAVAGLRYDALEEFLNSLSHKLSSDSIADRGRNRSNLADTLKMASMLTETAAFAINKAWRISKPYEIKT